MIAIIGLFVVILFALMLAYRNANNEHKKIHGSDLTVNEWLKSSIDEDLRGLIQLLIGTAVIDVVFLFILLFIIYFNCMYLKSKLFLSVYSNPFGRMFKGKVLMFLPR